MCDWQVSWSRQGFHGGLCPTTTPGTSRAAPWMVPLGKDDREAPQQQRQGQSLCSEKDYEMKKKFLGHELLKFIIQLKNKMVPKRA